MNVQIDIINVNQVNQHFPWPQDTNTNNNDRVYRYRFSNGFTYYRLTNFVYGPEERDQNIQDTIGLIRTRFLSTYTVDNPEELTRVLNQTNIPADYEFVEWVFDHFHDNEDLLMEIFDHYLPNASYYELVDIVDEFYIRQNNRRIQPIALPVTNTLDDWVPLNNYQFDAHQI